MIYNLTGKYITQEEVLETIKVYGRDSVETKEKIFNSFISFITKAAKYNINNKYGFTTDEFVEAGVDALFRAIETYDDSKGVPFVSWAKLAITGSMKNYINSRRIFRDKCDELNGCIKTSDDFNINSNSFIDRNSKTPFEELSSKDDHIIVRMIVETIKNQKHKKIVKMYYGICGYEKHTLKEIANIYNCSIQNVKTKIDCSVKKLKNSGLLIR